MIEISLTYSNKVQQQIDSGFLPVSSRVVLNLLRGRRLRHTRQAERARARERARESEREKESESLFVCCCVMPWQQYFSYIMMVI